MGGPDFTCAECVGEEGSIDEHSVAVNLEALPADVAEELGPLAFGYWPAVDVGWFVLVLGNASEFDSKAG